MHVEVRGPEAGIQDFKGFDAVGSFSSVRTRSSTLQLLSYELLPGAVLEKLKKTMKETLK
jgi:hypothetical protein